MMTVSIVDTTLLLGAGSDVRMGKRALWEMQKILLLMKKSIQAIELLIAGWWMPEN